MVPKKENIVKNLQGPQNTQENSDYERALEALSIDRRPWWESFFLLLVGIIGFSFPYMVTNSFSASREFHFTPYLSFELFFPRIEWMIVPYFSAYFMPLLVLSRLPYLAQKALMKAINLAGMIGVVVFILFPTVLGYQRTLEGLGFWRPMYEILWSLDQPHNLTPSMHVTMAYLMVMPVMHLTTSQFFKWAMRLWLWIVCASIILVHQHHLLDLILGYGVGMFAEYKLYRPAVIKYAEELLWRANEKKIPGPGQNNSSGKDVA